MSNAEAATTTPILDLVSPLPEKQSRSALKWWQALAVVLGIFVGAPAIALLALGSPSIRRAADQLGRYIEALIDGYGHYGPLLTFLVWVIVVLVGIAFHEIGHLLAAHSQGFTSVALAIGPVAIVRSFKGTEISLRGQEMFDGFTDIEIDTVRTLRRRLQIFVVAGPAANGVCAILAAIPILIPTLRHGLPPLVINGLAFLTGWSLLMAMLNLFPFLRSDGMFTDGARLQMLLSSLCKSRRWFSLLALKKEARSGVPPRLWHQTWVRAAVAAPDHSLDALLGFQLAYYCAIDQGDSSAASRHLEACLERADIANPVLRDILVLEAVLFHALFRHNGEKAHLWFAQARRLAPLPKLVVVRARIALHVIDNRFQDALRSWEQGLAWIRSLPDTPQRHSFEREWTEWKSQILSTTNPSEG